MVSTGTGDSPTKVISQSDAPFDGGSASKPATPETANTGVRVAAKTFAEIKAEMKAKAAGLAPKPETKAPEPKAPETKPETTTATVDGLSDTELSTFVTASKDKRASNAKIKALESDPNVQLAKDIAAAVAAGDHRKAAQLAKIDTAKLNEQEIAAANEPQKTPEQEAIAKLQEQIDALKGVKPAPTQDAQRTKGRNDIAEAVIADPKTYPSLAADRNAIEQAMDHAEGLYGQITSEKKRALTQQETERLFAKCMELAEATAAKAKADAVTDTKRTQHSTQPDPPSQRQSSPPPSLQSSKNLSFEEARKLIWRK